MTRQRRECVDGSENPHWRKKAEMERNGWMGEKRQRSEKEEKRSEHKVW